MTPTKELYWFARGYHDERRDLLESLRKRFARENEELRGMFREER